jgi:putative DNA primase/helicase
MATNTPPRFSDKSGAIWRRLIYFPLTVQIPEHERVIGMDRPEFWSSELSGILNWALVGYHRLYQRGRFIESTVNDQALEEYKTESNPVRLYFDECIEECVDAFERVDDIYLSYANWCKRSGFKPFSKIIFGKEVARRYHSPRVGANTARDELPTLARQRTIEGSRVRIYEGIMIKQQPQH